MDISIDWGRDRRLAAFGATALVHLVLVLGWPMARQPPAEQADGTRMRIQWIALPAPSPAMRPAPQPAQRPQPESRARPAPAAPVPAAPTRAPRDVPPSAAPQSAVPAASGTGTGAPSAPPLSTILDRAQRDVGAIDRALRKENKPLIVLPPDSPQLRLQKGIEHAAEMAPNAWYQAPKTAELVNNTGDGARRTRVITGNRTYCITERAPTTNVEMIEMHGKIRLTNCPENETPPQAQEWHAANE